MRLEDGLVNLCLQRVRIIGAEPERSQERCSTGEIALCLCDSRLKHNRIYIVGRYVENLLQLREGLRKATKADVGARVL